MRGGDARLGTRAIDGAERGMTTAPPAGWYADPSTDGLERYWDGTAWTSTTRAGGTWPSGAPLEQRQSAAPPAPPAASGEAADEPDPELVKLYGADPTVYTTAILYHAGDRTFGQLALVRDQIWFASGLERLGGPATMSKSTAKWLEKASGQSGVAQRLGERSGPVAIEVARLGYADISFPWGVVMKAKVGEHTWRFQFYNTIFSVPLARTFVKAWKAALEQASLAEMA